MAKFWARWDGAVANQEWEIDPSGPAWQHLLWLEIPKRGIFIGNSWFPPPAEIKILDGSQPPAENH